MIQMDLFTKQKQTHRHKIQTRLPEGKGGRDGSISNLGVANTHYYI